MKHILSLLLLSSLVICISGCKKEDPDKIVKIYSMAGKVTIVVKNVEKAAAVGDILSAGVSIRTGADSIADILFGTAGILRIQPGSSISISSLMDPKTGDSQLDMSTGKMSVTLAKLLKGNFRVKTSTAVAAVRGTSFRISADEKSMRLDVVTGTVNVNPVQNNAVLHDIEKTVETNQTVEIDEKTVKQAVEEKKEIKVTELRPDEIRLIREELKDIKPDMLDKVNDSARKELKEKILPPDDSARRDTEKEDKEKKEKERNLRLLQEKKLREKMIQKKAEPARQHNESKPAETQGEGSKTLPPSVNTL